MLQTINKDKFNMNTYIIHMIKPEFNSNQLNNSTITINFWFVVLKLLIPSGFHFKISLI